MVDQYLVNYKDLCKALVGEPGLGILASVNYAELAQDSISLLGELLKLPVSTSFSSVAV